MHKTKKVLGRIGIICLVVLLVSVTVLSCVKTAYAAPFDAANDTSNLVLPPGLDAQNDDSGILGYFSQLIMSGSKNTIASSIGYCTNQYISLYKFSNEQIKLMGYTLPTNMATIGSTSIPFASVYSVISNVSTYLTPLGYSILALVYLTKTLTLLKEPSGGSANQTPYVEQIFWLWFQFAILKTVLDNSMALTGMLFNLVAQVCQTIAAHGVSGTSTLSEIVSWNKANLADIDAWYAGKLVIGGKTCVAPGIGQFGIVAAVWLLTIIVSVATFVISVVTYAVVLGRWLQLFIYLQFAPVMFAFLGLDDTKPMAISYMKSIFSIGIATLITLLLVMALPGVYISMLKEITVPRMIVDGLLSCLKCCAVALIYIKLIAGSSTFAKEMIGG